MGLFLETFPETRVEASSCQYTLSSKSLARTAVPGSIIPLQRDNCVPFSCCQGDDDAALESAMADDHSSLVTNLTVR